MKVVINACFGVFGLSDKAIIKYAELKGIKLYGKKWHFTEFYTDPRMIDKSYYYLDIKRNDPHLIQVVEEMGSKANGNCASLKIVEVPEDANWYIEEYDGYERVAEQHRTWS